MGEKWIAWRQYSVSNMGRVRGPRGKIIKLAEATNGYLFFSASTPERGPKSRTSTFVHRLVAKLFNRTKKIMMHVHHRDHNKKNNMASNLMWVTRSENMRYAYEAGRCEACRENMRVVQRRYLQKAIATKIARYGSANARSARKDQKLVLEGAR
jgi:hypothetical protein